MFAFKRSPEDFANFSSKGVVVECMTLFTKMSLKWYEDNFQFYKEWILGLFPQTLTTISAVFIL